jgi:hypothetical protein
MYRTDVQSSPVLTIAETEIFSALWPDYWTAEEFGEFCAWLAANPDAGDVIKGSGGCRKVRWGVSGRGKRGGVRVIYFRQLEEGKLWLLVMYAKNVRASIGADVLRQIRETIDG